jgi:hypothetical protein
MVSFYRRGADNVAVLYTGADCWTYPEPRAEIDVAGLETSLEVSLQPWLEAGASYGVCRVDDQPEGSAGCLPEQVIGFGAAAAKRLSNHVSVGITVAGRYVAPVEVGSRLAPCKPEALCIRDAELPEYTSALVNVHVDIDRAVVFFKVQNVADTEIRTGWGRPVLPKRSYEFGVSALLAD